MDDLFLPQEAEADLARQPLAARMRPQSLDEVAGQTHILGKGKLLRRLIESDRLTGAIFYGPPGTGKTTLARVIAKQTQAQFHELNAVEASVADLRKVFEHAELAWRAHQKKTLLLVDEIHRFSKSQQDVLLPYVERGAVRLIGATTQNPFFYIAPALVSRMQVFEFQPVAPADITVLLKRAMVDEERGLGKYHAQADEDALKFLAEISNGDVRQPLNALEVAVLTTPTSDDGVIHVTLEVAEESIQKRAVRYDADGDAHYDTISAFIKSVRGSEPDTALYWLGKMLLAGEDPRFIARRLIILASEDIGLAEPQALPIAVACHQAVETIGMPEGRIPLAETTVYLATAPKSNAAYMAIDKVLGQLKSGAIREVPAAVRDTHYKSSAKLGHGEGYQYAHDYDEAIAPKKTVEDLPTFYEPTRRGYEKIISERLERWAQIRKNQRAAQNSEEKA